MAGYRVELELDRLTDAELLAKHTEASAEYERAKYVPYFVKIFNGDEAKARRYRDAMAGELADIRTEVKRRKL